MLLFKRRKISCLFLFATLTFFGLVTFVVIQMLMPPAINVKEARLNAVADKLHKLDKILYQQIAILSKMKNRLLFHNSNKNEVCIFDAERVAYPDIQMLDLYKKTNFNSKFSGYVEWDINYDASKYDGKKNKLQVFVVPFSHIDPGWLRKYDSNYYFGAKHVLTSMYRELLRYDDMKFIWSEMCYFSTYYESLTDEEKTNIKSFVENGQLEFLTGGWVMTDEANSHWFSILMQLTEGHRFLKETFNMTPKNSWSVDPFGYSPTLPYLLRNVGINNLLIQRVHHLVKRSLGDKQQLEFLWRQLWDDTGDTEVFTHLMPFVSYDIKHSCGPDFDICESFDFHNARWYKNYNETSPEFIERVNWLVDQWKRKAELYQTGIILMPLGDDFRYMSRIEWTEQRSNFNKIFNIINNNPKYSVVAKFGTLQDYFDAVHAKVDFHYPTLSGDFFTYSDYDGDYWSGYFTSRPAHKRLDRILLRYIRSAEMLSAWSNAGIVHHQLLQSARRALSIFQHHDAITGTSKANVMEDFKQRLLKATTETKTVMQQSIYQLLHDAKLNESIDINDIKDIILDDPLWFNNEQKRIVITSDEESEEKYIILHNSLPQTRMEIIDLVVDSPFVVVTEFENKKTINAQINNIWNWRTNNSNGNTEPELEKTQYRLQFKAEVPAFCLTVYILQFKKTLEDVKSTTFARNYVLTTQTFGSEQPPAEPLKIQYSHHREVELRFNIGPHVKFSLDGYINGIKLDNDSPFVPITLEFIKYKPSLVFRSGAYIFHPNGGAETLKASKFSRPTVLIEAGDLVSSVSVGLPFALHQTILRRNEIPEIRNLFHIKTNESQEIAMRLKIDIQNNNIFYTDLNGLQMIKRQRFSTLPIQGNYYPVSTAIYIEDDNTRLTVISAQPLGGGSLKEGHVEIMQDRRLFHDDLRGLSEPVKDNQPVLLVFRISLENIETCATIPKEQPSGILTYTAYRNLQQLLYPIDQYVCRHKNWWGTKANYCIFNKPFDDDIELVVARNLLMIENMDGQTMQTENDKLETGFVVHRTNYLSCDESETTTGLLHLAEFKNLYGAASVVKMSSITFTERFNELTRKDKIMLCPMETKAFIVTEK